MPDKVNETMNTRHPPTPLSGVLTRAPGDTLVLAPPFVARPEQVDRMVPAVRSAIVATSDIQETSP